MQFQYAIKIVKFKRNFKFWNKKFSKRIKKLLPRDLLLYIQ